MSNFGVRETDEKPSELIGKKSSEFLEKVRAHILAEREKAPPAATVLTDDTATDARPASLPPGEAPAPAPIEVPNQLVAGMQTALCGLDEEQLLQILEKLPAHQLASALHRLLKPSDSAPMEQPRAGTKAAERRGAPRTRTLRAGKIVYNNGMSLTDCEIRDISETGCRVSVASTIGVPDQFMLAIPNERIKRGCVVAWRKSGMMGLKFDT